MTSTACQPIASLPWYDGPQTHTALDEFWTVLRHALCGYGVEATPLELDRSTPLEKQWGSPRLLISQCCGPDLYTEQASNLVVLARPVFSDLDCAPGTYYSHIVASKQYSKGPARLVVNSLSSRSGHGALLEWCQERQQQIQSITVSGSHHNSMHALQTGQADLAAIDAHSWNHLPTPQLPIIGRSHPAPSPPYVMHRNNTHFLQPMHQALKQSLATAGQTLQINTCIEADKVTYQHTLCERQLSPT